MPKKPTSKKPAAKKPAPEAAADKDDEPKRYAVLDRNREISRHDTMAEAEAAAADLRCRAGARVVIQDTKSKK